MMIKWEYKHTRGHDELDNDALNEYGESGWELVSVIGMSRRPTDSIMWTYHFKRPIEMIDLTGIDGVKRLVRKDDYESGAHKEI